ncbi:hypothetical protein B0T19DRAFT_79399 [Cercophora scortea]|uniref:Uncharacterized protein n=1 Tax=Cercophora scortea TaxID=314031 RepID=A0AAE0MM21_9PEZI|nr:hypothetical protein B0T19DRAFT_79399 [Cercophora scortea]
MHGEMLGLCEALCIAYEYALGGRLFKGTVKVFSDSMESLNILGMLRNTEELERVVSDPIVKPIVEAIIWLSHRLRECRIHTDLHWIPGHGHNVYPHQLVDRTSRDVWTGEWQRTVDSYLPMRWGLRGETWEYEEADWSEEVGRLMYSMRAYLMRKNTRDGATYNRKEERSKEDLSDVEEGQVVEVQRIA